MNTSDYTPIEANDPGEDVTQLSHKAQGLDRICITQGDKVLWCEAKDSVPRYGEPLCSLPKAQAVIDQLKAENEVLTLRVMVGERQELATFKSAPVVMPERSTDTDWLRSNDEYNEGWNDCLDEVARLNRSKT